MLDSSTVLSLIMNLFVYVDEMMMMIDESQIQEAVQVSFDDTSSIRFVPTRKKARGQVRKYKQMIKKENKKKIYKKMISLEECVRKSLAMEEELWFYLVDMTLTYR
ncbi:hypothetical protein F2Q70_00041526 [Brassica cretica]|uniref:Uncharacterized protein n=1 Tax=Brassica cretica TaxID=69181 RepID=A0A8S9K3M6_BRACR|nr:hypothetical protein F2Q70_00041526 [Brassica cretica]KAF3496373.1 hypothetical protein DY000_02057415 [Brassica cretica]